MSGEYKKPGLFDVSGNLTVKAMESFLAGGLSPDEKMLVQKHLDESPFDREALEGLQKHYSSQNLDEIEELRKSVILSTTKLPETGKRIPVSRTYWYAAAGLALLMGISIFMVLMFRPPQNKTELAVLQPDTIVDTATATATAVVQEDQKQAMSENDIVPAPPSPVKQINIVEDDALAEEKELSTEPEIVNNEVAIEDVIIVESDLVADEKVVGGIEASDINVQEEYIVTSEMAAQESNGRAMSKMALDSEDEVAEESQIFMVVETMPEFPGGEEALYKYLMENIKYPQLNEENAIQLKVYVTFVVEKDGSISDVRVLRGSGSALDEEAIRVIKSMPKWLPGKQRGIPIRVQYNIPISISLQ